MERKRFENEKHSKHMTNGLMSFMQTRHEKKREEFERGYKLFEKEALEELARDRKLNAKKKTFVGFKNANRTSSRLIYTKYVRSPIRHTPFPHLLLPRHTAPGRLLFHHIIGCGAHWLLIYRRRVFTGIVYLILIGFKVISKKITRTTASNAPPPLSSIFPSRIYFYFVSCS